MEINLEVLQAKFGANVRLIRKNKNLSAETVAIQGVLADKTFVHSIERGERNVQLSTIFKLAKGLNVEPKDLLDFDV